MSDIDRLKVYHVVAMLAIICFIIGVIYMIDIRESPHAPQINPLPEPTYDPWNISKTTIKHDSLKTQEHSEEVLSRFVNASQP